MTVKVVQSIIKFCQVKLSCIPLEVLLKSDVKMEYIREELVEELSETRVWCRFENCDRGRSGRRPSNKSPGMSGQDANIRRHYKIHGYEWRQSKRAKIDDCGPTVLIPASLVTREQYWSNILAMHCELNFPFSVWNDKYMLENQRPYTSHFEITLNSETVRDRLKLHHCEVLRTIRDELDKKLFSLRFDIATNRNRSLLGVSVQFMKDWAIVVRHVGIIELEDSHTADLIEKKIKDLLPEIGLDMDQIYSVTTDSSANVLRAPKITLEDMKFNDADGMELEQAGTEPEDADEEQLPPVVREAEEALRQLRTNDDLQCCGQVIQLAVEDFLARHHEKMIEVKKKAIVHLRASWSSNYHMMLSLLANKHNIDDKTLDWTFVEDLMAALKPAAELIVEMQKTVQYTIGDFARDFYICQYQVRKNTRGTTTLGGLGLDNDLWARGPTVFKGIQFLVAIYLDPRYNNKDTSNTNRFLSRDDKDRCVEYLVKLSERVNVPSIAESSVSITSSHSSSPPDSPFSMDVADFPTAPTDPPPVSPTFWSNFYFEMYGDRTPTTSSAVRDRIIALQYRDREQLSNFNILKYWAAKAPRDPEIATIAAIVLAAPANQLTSERLFNNLTHADSSMLNTQLTVKLNGIYDTILQ